MRARWVMLIPYDKSACPKRIRIDCYTSADILELLRADETSHIRVSHWYTLNTTGNRIALYTLSGDTVKARARNQYLKELVSVRGYAIVAGHRNDYDLGDITKRELHEYLQAIAERRNVKEATIGNAPRSQAVDAGKVAQHCEVEGDAAPAH